MVNTSDIIVYKGGNPATGFIPALLYA